MLEPKQAHPDTIVSYFYFDFNDAEKQSSKKAIRSLLFQCALHANDILDELERLYDNCGGGQLQPAEDLLQSLFTNVVALPREKYIVLDALDECTDRVELLAFIRELTASNAVSLHILATSRREKDIEDEMNSLAHHNINIQSTIVDTDIRIYIQDRMGNDAKLKKWPTSVQDEITDALMKRADGMYERLPVT
jgi:hypothetical protein